MIDRSVLLRLFFKLVLLEEYFFTTSHQYSGILSNLCSLENKKLHVLAMYIRSYKIDIETTNGLWLTVYSKQ